MSTINRLSSVDVLQPSDQIPVWDSSNGDTRKASMSTLLAFIESNFADPDQSTRIVAPSINGFNVDVGDTGDSTWLIINPDANYASGSISLPSTTYAVNDQEITVVFTASVTAFSITGTGATVQGAPTGIAVYDSFILRYNAVQSTWYTFYLPAPALSGTSSDLVTYAPAGGSAVATNVQVKLRETVSAEDFGAVGDGATDDTVAIQAALDSGASSVEIPGLVYAVHGTLTIPPGVTLRGTSAASEYYPAGPGSELVGSCLFKPVAGTAGPLVIMSSSSALTNLYLKHIKTNGANTGIIQMGVNATGSSIYNAKVTDVRLYGDLTTDVTGANTCYGVYFPRSISIAQRYFNIFNGVYITNCDVAIHLDEESNANNFTSIITRQCYHHYELDGNANTSCVDNTFTGLSLFNIGTLPTTPTKCFVLSNGAIYNNFSGYQTECNGQAFDIDATSNLNLFSGQENEITGSYVPVGGTAGPTAGSVHSRWQRPLNNEQFTQMLLPSLTTGAKYESAIIGSKVSLFKAVETGDGLPALDGAGTLVAATAHSRSIVQFNSTVYAKTLFPNMRCKLSVFVQAAGTGGQAMATVEFMYVCTNTSTGAGVLRVLNKELAPAASNYISGLKFLTGVAGSTPFGIAIVGGNLSAALAANVIVSLDIDIYKPAGVNRDFYYDIDTVSTACTANDVTNAITLLTVADTII
jgi:hypothetical protein